VAADLRAADGTVRSLTAPGGHGPPHSIITVTAEALFGSIGEPKGKQRFSTLE
jgi:hypothetical protein